jgi:hypothetical protein
MLNKRRLNMTTTALATTRGDGLALYRDIWLAAKTYFWDPARTSALNAFEHRFDNEINDIPSAKRYAKSMLETLNDRYTKLLDEPEIEEVAAVAEATEGSASSAVMPNNIGLLCIDSFSPENIVEQVRKALMDIAHCDGFIIDLRDNRGGLVNPTLFCLELFLEEGKLATLESQGRNGFTKTDIFVKPGTYYKRVEPDVNERTGNYERADCVIKGKPVVLLISESTCSSAELFAAALLESGNNFTMRLSMGKQTAGKGIIQDTVPLNGCSLVVTSGRYLSPSNRWFGDHGQTVANGIKPNIDVYNPHAKSTVWKAHSVLCDHLGKKVAPEYRRTTEAANPFAVPALVGLMAVGAFLTFSSILLTPSRK